MAQSAPPPSRFGAGYTAGATSAASPTARAPAPDRRLNRLAAVTLGAALFLGLVVAPLTLPLSYLAQRQIRASGHAGSNVARAAMLISAAYLFVGVVVVGLYLYLTGLSGAR